MVDDCTTLGLVLTSKMYSKGLINDDEREKLKGINSENK